MEIDSEPTQPLRSDLPAMFRPPVNRAMRVLDRSFFKKTVPISAAAIFKTSDISNVRKELTKSRDMLVLPRLGSIREIKVNDLVHKCLLLREDIKHDGMTCYRWYGDTLCGARADGSRYRDVVSDN